MRRPSGGRQGNLARNAAFFLGALGTTLGVFGAAFGVVALAPAGPAPPQWVLTAGVVVFLILIVGLWPALDWLVGHDYWLGAAALTALGLVVGSVGWAVLAQANTNWAVVGWMALSGAPLLLGSAWLVLSGHGTEPLTWRSLRTPRVIRVERRLRSWLALLFGALTLSWLLTAWTGNLVLGFGIGSGVLLAAGLWQWGSRR